MTGAISFIEKGELISYVMPVVSDGKRKRVDVLAFESILARHIPCGTDHFIVYERPVGSKSINAAVSMADSFARIDTVMSLRSYKREAITPQKWQRTFWSKPKMAKGTKFDTKAAALLVARRLWPSESFLANDRCRVAHDGIVDAVLIAEYCRRMYKT